MTRIVSVLAALLLLWLANCGEPLYFPSAVDDPRLSVAVTLNGATGLELVSTIVNPDIENDPTDPILISSDGTYYFQSTVKNESEYTLSIATEPEDFDCSIENEIGIISELAHALPAVTCSVEESTVEVATHSISATVTLNGATGLVLVNDTSSPDIDADPTQPTEIDEDGTYLFRTKLPQGAGYEVSIETEPTGYNCSIENPSGTVDTTDVSNITVDCVAEIPDEPTYAISATVALNGGSGLVLVNNATSPTIVDDPTTSTPINSDGTYQFRSDLPKGATYNITVKTPAPGYSCSVTNGTGTMAEIAVTDISVTCTALPRYALSATVVLNGATGLVLVNNATNPTVTNDPTQTATINANGTYQFTSTIPTGSEYIVSVATQPTNYSCTVTNGSGTMASANVTNVSVSCSFVCNCPATYTASDSGLFCTKTDSSASPGSFIPIQQGDTNGAYGPNGPVAFVFSNNAKYPFKDNNGTLRDADGNNVSTNTTLTGNFWGGRLNAISIKPDPTPATSDFYELSFCLTAPTTREYVFGIASDNGMGFSVGGKRLFESSLEGDAYGSTFNYWWLGSITLNAGTYPVNFLWNDRGGAAALGYEFYQNTLSEVVAADELTDLTILDRSSSHIGDTTYALQGSTCATGYSYNACTSQCVKILTAECNQ